MHTDELLLRSHAARQTFLDTERELLERLVHEGQAPHTMFIGCSDSRVVAESLTGSRPGELFVVRLVANIVPPYGSGQYGVQAAVDFAVETLLVPRIVVCGHTECGGIRALDAPFNPQALALDTWLSYARPARERLGWRGSAHGDRDLALVEENVGLQLEHLRTYPSVARAIEEDRVKLHGWVFDMNRLQMRWCHPDGEFHVFITPDNPQDPGAC